MCAESRVTEEAEADDTGNCQIGDASYASCTSESMIYGQDRVMLDEQRLLSGHGRREQEKPARSAKAHPSKQYWMTMPPARL